MVMHTCSTTGGGDACIARVARIVCAKLLCAHQAFYRASNFINARFVSSGVTKIATKKSSAKKRGNLIRYRCVTVGAW